ncbi:CheR family methyltransferase [Candidatus Methylocalor cossyra]|uniref:Uncharacterized 104.1 kDa protein in hypE 3'region n=1 Tax=Candidatus Methylocalor cossyra TaxID=3108543 RepID=A0ABM9NKH8_9GAMM
MIVGVGASAGGLAAFQELLEGLPAPTGMALVFVQHFKSATGNPLRALLGRHTPLAVVEARDGMPLAEDHLYLAPPGTLVTVRNAVLTVETAWEPAALRRTIDTFLCSLADDQGPRAVGVLLSGNAGDGLRGLEAIKARGGIALVQAERTARFAALPRRAILAGLADRILPPREIARELVKLRARRKASPRPPAGREPATGAEPWEQQEALRRILDRVRSVSRVDFSAYKPSTLRRRIQRRMALYRVERLADYARRLEEDPAEAEALGRDLVINVTRFFRDPEVFETLRTEIFPRILAGKSPDAPLRIWVPGCSTGEEVYSLAIAALETLEQHGAQIPLQLFGTDISDVAIGQARAGIYPEPIAGELSPDRLRRFFVKHGTGYRVAKAIRELCVFARHNVFNDPPFFNLDLISCRNVLIYFGPDLQRKVLPLFHFALNERGFLVLGNSESIGAFAELFVLTHKRHKIYQKKSAPPRLTLDRPPRADDGELLGQAARAEGVPSGFDPLREADRVLLDRYSPPGVVVNSDLTILQFRGRTDHFLQPAPGGASFHLLRMAREGLMIPLHVAIHEAGESGCPVRKKDVLFQGYDETCRVTLEVVPIAGPASLERFFLVLFQEFHPAGASPAGWEAPGELVRPPAGPAERDEIARLREELAATREYLRSVIESQEALTEELRSANEELQSTNEELETAKEELQSSNEELTTFNEELQARNEELARANDDLTNLLRGTDLAVVILDQELRLRRFTPSAEQLFGLAASDLGRPIDELGARLALPGLLPLVQSALTGPGTQEVGVRAGNGRWYKLKAYPYRTLDDKIEGAVLALWTLEGPQPALPQGPPEAPPAEAGRESPVLLVSGGEFRVRTANGGFYRLAGLAPEAVEGRPLFALADGRWDLPPLRAALEGLVSGKSACQNLIFEHDVAGVGRCRVKLDGRLGNGTEGEPVVLITLEALDVAPVR